jgi:hypothetical protein
VAGIVEAQRHLTVRDMLDGIGGTLPAIAAMRFALCAVALFTNSPTVVASYKPIDRQIVSTIGFTSRK